MTVYINAISGLTPFGNLEETWKGITDNKVCYGNLTKFPWDKYTRSKVAGEVKFNAEDYSSISERDREKMPEYMQWALASAQELLEGQDLEKDRTGVIVSSALSMHLETLRANEKDAGNTFTFTPNMISNNINIKYNIHNSSIIYII